MARSLGAHWSVGVFGEANTSSFENTDFSMEAAPALEYNLFPYSESTRREFRFMSVSSGLVASSKGGA